MSSTDVDTRLRARHAAPGATEYMLLIALSLAWGTSFMFTKVAVESVTPVTLIAVRTVIATIAMFGLFAFQGRLPRLTYREVGAFALVGLTANAAPLCLIAISVSHVPSGVTAVTMAVLPLLTALLGLFRGDVPKPRTIVGILVGLVGIVVLFGPKTFASFGDSAMGLASAIGAAVIFAISLFLVAMVRHRDAVTVTAYSSVAAALWSVPTALLIDGSPHFPSTYLAVVSVLVLALWNTAAANLLLFALVKRTGPAFTSYNNYLVPAVAVACGTIFLGEPLTYRSILGVAIVVVGIAISTIQWRGRRPLPPLQ